MPPIHKGELDPAVGALGAGLTVTVVNPAGLLQPATFANTEYVPAANVLVLAIVGFCTAEVNVFGPTQV